MSFLDHLEGVTARVRRGEMPSLDELRELKAENRRRAEAAEAEDRAVCDSLPTWIGAQHSTVCNLRCVFCDQAYGKTPDLRMADTTYRRVVEELYPAAETVQLSTYGEPMMTPQIHQKLTDMERFGVKLEMITNATLLRGDSLLERMARNMRYLRVSIDGATPRTYNRLRAGADFDEVIGIVRRYNHFRHRLPAGERAPLDFSFILMKSTLDELPSFVRLARELAVNVVQVHHLVVFEAAMRPEMLSEEPDWRRRTNEVLERTRETAAQIGQRVALPPPFALDGDPSVAAPRAEPVRCWFLWQRMFVGPFGQVAPCCLAGIHSNGDARDGTFAEIWNNERYQSMRRMVHSAQPHEPCASCYLVNRNPDSGNYDRATVASERNGRST